VRCESEKIQREDVNGVCVVVSCSPLNVKTCSFISIYSVLADTSEQCYVKQTSSHPFGFVPRFTARTGTRTQLKGFALTCCYPSALFDRLALLKG